MLAPILQRLGTGLTSVSSVKTGSYYLVVTINSKRQLVAYCLKATGTSDNTAMFYKRDFRNAGHTMAPVTVSSYASNIYEITPLLTEALESEGAWFNEREYDR